LNVSLLSLPVEDVDCLLDFLLLVSGFSLLSLCFLFSIKHPKLCIDLFFNNLILKLGSLVHQLLFSFELATSYHELSFFFPQFIGFHLELSIKGSGNHFLSLLLSGILKGGKSLCHLFSYLFGSFK